MYRILNFMKTVNCILIVIFRYIGSGAINQQVRIDNINTGEA